MAKRVSHLDRRRPKDEPTSAEKFQADIVALKARSAADRDLQAKAEEAVRANPEAITALGNIMGDHGVAELIAEVQSPSDESRRARREANGAVA